MSDYKIITDSGCDLPKQMLSQLCVQTVPLIVNFRGECLEDSVDEGIKEMYAGLRAGEAASTSAVNPDRWMSLIEQTLSAGQDALVITFSSGLSTTYQSAVIAANELKEKYPDRKIFVVDGLSASLGQGLLIWYACKKKDEGLSVEELAAWVEENKLHLCHWFTVDDLMYLKRGGRISAATAVVGTMLKIKPVLHMDDEGHLIKVSVARGRRGSLDALCARMKGSMLDHPDQTVFIGHGDCLEDAQYLASKIKSEIGVEVRLIDYVGPVIGAHSGPGTVALFFLGKER